MKGILIIYGATGEGTRPQFIGYKSLDKDGRVKNHDQIYDLQEGDSFKIKKTNVIYTDSKMLFLAGFIEGHLFATGKDLEVSFKPAKGHKSWGELV